MKKKIYFILGFFIGILLSSTVVYAATKYLAKDITYKDTNVEDALNELYNLNSINYDNLKKINRTTTIDVEVGKKYLIAFNVTSYFDTQNYKPSIVSGCTIEKETEMIRSTYDVLANYTSAYIVTATDDTITFKGNIVDSNWNHIIYYEI